MWKGLEEWKVEIKNSSEIIFWWHDVFWLHMFIYDYFLFVFCIVPKNVLLLKYRKWVSCLKNLYHYAKVVEHARLNLSISPYCTLLFSRKENFKFFEVALSAILCHRTVGCLMNVWEYQYWNTANTTLGIYLLLENENKTLKQGVKFVQTWQSILQQLTFVLLVSFLLTLNTLL